MATSAQVLEHVKAEAPFDIVGSMQAAAAAHGKSLRAQVGEIWRLRFGPGKLAPDEYYAYQLYDDRRFSFADKRAFLGRAVQTRIIRQGNRALEWWMVAHDKLLFYSMLKGLGLPVPESVALYHGTRRFGAVGVLASPDELARHLRTGLPYPCFGKPVTGIRSVGVAALEAYRKEDDALILHDGTTVGVEAFVREIEPYRKEGYLFQEMLRPHAELEAVCGPRVSTVRLIVLLEDQGPSVLHALWKVPLGANPADNFWRPGNMLAALDAASGRVGRVIQGVGPDQRQLDRHPETGQPLLGMALPDWNAAVELCLSAAKALPGLRMQAWDVAPTDRGPVLVEVNIGGDFNLPQLAHARGLMDERFRRFLASCG
jgi:hypothetical protein